MSSSFPTISDVERWWSARPCNVLHSLAVIGSKRWSDEVTQRKYLVEPHIPEFAEFSKWYGKQVLEIGCGIGTDTLEFARSGARVHAVDVSQKSIELAQKRLQLNFFGNATLYCLDAERTLPYAGGTKDYIIGFDLAYSFGVIHHTPNPEKIVENVYKRLKPGGEFRLMLYAKWSIKHLLGFQPEAQANCPIVNYYTARSVRHLLKKFEIVSIRKTHIFRWRLEDYLQHRYEEAFPYSVMPSQLFKMLEGVGGHHLLIIARKPL